MEQIVIGVCMRCGKTTTDIEGGGLFPGLLVCQDCKAKERAANIAASCPPIELPTTFTCFRPSWLTKASIRATCALRS